jgi:hypothetical protein
MSKKSLGENLSELIDVLKSYAATRVDIWKLALLEKLSLVGSYFLTSLMLIITLAFCFLFISFAFAFWYADYYGNLSTAFFILAGIYVFIGLVIYLLRRFIVLGPVIKNLSGILFEDTEKVKIKNVKIEKDAED